MPMAHNLVRKFIPLGVPVIVHARSRQRAAALVDAGASWAATPRELAAAEVVIVMVRDLSEIAEILDGEVGLLDGVVDPCLVVVGSSVDAEGLRELASRVDERTGHLARVIDSPVSGGVEGATCGTLSIMVGGSEADVATAWSSLSAFGTPVHLGPVGSGQVAKACNQLVVAATMVALSEATVIAERSGLDLDSLLTTLGGGYAGSRLLEVKKHNLVNHDYSPSGIARFMVKDLTVAANAAKHTSTTTPLLAVLQHVFDELTEQGYGDQDVSVVHAYLAQLQAPPSGS